MKKSEIFPLVMLVLGAIGFALFGVKWLVNPTGMATPLGIILTNGDATSDARAVYGGMELGLGLFLAYSAIAPARRTQGLAAAAITLAGLGVSRSIGIIAAESVTSGTYALLATDLTGTVLCIAAFLVSRKND
ncbi:MAG: DUF4345 family protein [Polyangiaceae bacterium]